MKMIDHNHFICHLILGTFTEYPFLGTFSKYYITTFKSKPMLDFTVRFLFKLLFLFITIACYYLVLQLVQILQ